MNTLATICGLALLLAAVVVATPSYREKRQDAAQTIEDKMGLPSNSTAIRKNIVDTFSCEGKAYGYYADVDNECQLFHICYPVELADGKKQVFKWSFICPEQTIFDQSSMVCAWPTDALPCSDAPSMYNLNDNFGKIPEKKTA